MGGTSRCSFCFLAIAKHGSGTNVVRLVLFKFSTTVKSLLIQKA